MAIDKIKKVVFFVPSDIYEDFIVQLKSISAVEIIPQKQVSSNGLYGQKFLNYNYEEIKLLTNKIESVITLQRQYFPNITFTIPEFKFSKELLLQQTDKTIKICDEVHSIDNEIKYLQIQQENFFSKLQLLENFCSLDVDVSELLKLRQVKFYFLKIHSKKYRLFVEKIKNLNTIILYDCKRTKEEIYSFVLLHKSEETKFNEVVKEIELSVLPLENYVSTTIKKEIAIIKEKIEKISSTIIELTEKLKQIYKENFVEIYITYIKCLELSNIFEVQSVVDNTKYTKILFCWIPYKFLNKLNKLLKEFSSVSIVYFEPQKDEDVPTVLVNKQLIQPYEFVTTLYGYPKFGSVDPTELLAPFFTIFFGLCLSDVFYGFLMLCSWALLKNKINKHSEYYNMVCLFKYLGITSIIVGIFLDSFLGFSIVKNFKFPVNVAIFDPLNRPIDMLKFCFLLGIIQITFGLLVNTYKNFKEKEILDGIDSLSWAVFIIIFAPVVYNIFFPKNIAQNLLSISTKISVIVFVFIVIFQSRKTKPVFLAPVTLFVKAYNVIGYYADILSYSRILALALATSAIAQTINILVAKLFKAELLGIKYVEPAIAPVLFLGGHIFNFIIGILGGLVHSARLQYLEFFSKFFVSGGRPIKIFRPIK